MSNYRLVLVIEGDAPSRTGFLFCTGHDHARRSAEALLAVHLDVLAIELADDSGPVCRLERAPATVAA